MIVCAGGIGLCAVSAAAIVDAYPIILVDVNHEKLSFARKFGAARTIYSGNVDAISQIRDLTRGGVDFAVDAIGLPQTQKKFCAPCVPGIPA